ncbi:MULTISPECIES: 2-isopropylmalate synthase [Jeotgalicoccus]|uniref:2-isopropylmalate synthase n=1 Tax=Jeotgalicoccus TaxID=227979 RepID=UPI00047D57A8|nr:MULTISPECIES: 2-isopropylmalate synthase [Jeotgalicoccus]QQD86078.1 2-isopropylmalate synthase [Jeotgalicoccus sp. ATCC 8456]
MTDIKIFDTTLRDGEQSPGVNLNKEEKLEIAKQLERLGVDVIEAGFPASSVGDFQAVKLIADTVKNSTVTALARAKKSDIDRAYEALKNAERSKLHVFLATSPIHREFKLKKTQQEVLETSVEMVKYAKTLFDEVEWSAEDASRTELPFLAEIIEAVIDAGATIINLPDTVGYSTPKEYGEMFKYVSENVPNIEKAILSTHCHNDLGMAVANSIAGIENGARQIEVSINGIGERAGNAALEEIAVALHIRSDAYNFKTNLVLNEIKRSSDIVAKLTGMSVQPNKAIIGRNAYAHEAGIHQDGMLKNSETYEIISPALVGVSAESANTLFLGKHSGRHAFKDKVKSFKIELTEDELTEAFNNFKVLTDHKKEVTDDDIYAIIMEIKTDAANLERYTLNNFQVNYEQDGQTRASIVVTTPKNEETTHEVTGKGSVEVLYEAIQGILSEQTNLLDYQLSSVGGGKDALAEARVQINVNGNRFSGRGTAQDVLEASANAYFNAVNRYLMSEKANNQIETVQS